MKLAQETKAGAILQLCLYAELLQEIQQIAPERVHVVPRRPDFPLETYRLDDYLAYYRLVRRQLEAALDADPARESTYPDPVPHCEVCRWWKSCDRRQRDDDHLSLVAGATRLQRRELVAHAIGTLARLAVEPLPIAWTPSRGAREGYGRVREQARIQLEGRRARDVRHELLPIVPGFGLASLPAPSRGDLFLDLEADPYVDAGGLEYLFGWVVVDPPRAGTLALEVGAPRYHARWALDRAAERRGFEAVIDTILEHWASDPDMHVYHYGVYEPGAIKRLMGRHATRAAEVDRLLRANRFVDLHAVVKQALRASVEEYSIKKLEPLYGFEREQPLEPANAALRVIQRSLELGAPVAPDDENGRQVEAYNRDDCVSTLALRDWLERLREQAVAEGAEIERPVWTSGDPRPEIDDRERRAQALAARLLEGIPEDPLVRSPEQQATWLLANMLEFHRREDKADWWEYYRLIEPSDADLLEETAGLAGLEFVDRRPAQGRTPVDRYRFPLQDTSVRRKSKLKLPLPADCEFGDVVAIDLAARTIDVKKRGACADLHPSAVFAHRAYKADEQWESLLRLGTWVADHGIDADGDYRAARDLLLGLKPRRPGGTAGVLERSGEGGVLAARRIALELDHGVLAIQGPPGSGKTFTGARMICDLVRAGKRIGICATSHKVVAHLITGVLEAAASESLDVACLQKITDPDDAHADVRIASTNDEALGALQRHQAQVVGGTSWLWAREQFSKSVDVLFVDEAGQMSLAGVLAIAPAAASLVLLGDPRQLEQPIQSAHPEGTAVSALDHVLQGRMTIDPERGLFLEETWRLPPEICAFTSELFYEGRLRAHPTLGLQGLGGTGRFDGAGLWFVPAEHDARQNACREEVDAIAALIEGLLAGDACWRDRRGATHALALDDILVIAPYNAQVGDLIARLPAGARVGTVDRFQGQEAPVVIYSLTSSTPEDAPRGMEFLYNPNRLNVATSRAQCVCIVVGSPRLFEPDCRSPKQMKLANAFCRLLEVARR